MPTVGLTKRVVDEAKPEQGGEGRPRRTIYFDRDVKGFGLMVTERGVKSFILKYRAGRGRAAPTRRATIGRYGSPWTVEQARSEAKRLLGEVALAAIRPPNALSNVGVLKKREHWPLSSSNGSVATRPATGQSRRFGASYSSTAQR